MEENGNVLSKLLKIKLAVGGAVGCASLFFIFFPLIVVVLFVLGLFGDGGSKGTGGYVYDSSCNYENTMVTVMDGSNTKVLATVNLEDYLLGVVCPEIGACDGKVSDMQEHYIKIKFVAARTYVLARGGYNSSTKSISIRASTRDQQWCDLNKGCVVTKDGKYKNTYPGDYSGSEQIEIRRSYTEQDLELLRKYYKECYGELYLPTSVKSEITSFDGSWATEYKSKTQTWWDSRAADGKTYIEILDETGTSGKPDAEDYVGKSIYRLGDYCKATWTGGGNNVQLLNLDSYPSSSETKSLTTPIKSTLGDSDYTAFSDYIINSVNSAGYGTGEGVATAAAAFIYGLHERGYHLWYDYGGGHRGYDLVTGIYTDLGKSSFDCSGFVSWAIKNGCDSSYVGDVTGGFLRNYGNAYPSSSAISSAKPGDLMVYDQGGGTNGHVRVVIKNNGNSIITAESSGSVGIHFQEYSSLGIYSIIDMSNYYATKCESTNPNKAVNSSTSGDGGNSSSHDNLKTQINNYLSESATKGTWSVYVKDLKKNTTVDISSTKQMNSASVIKLFVLASVYDKVNLGEIDENSISSDAEIMIKNSDNDATNRLIDKVGGIEVVNNYINSNGFSNSTYLNRKFGGKYTNSGTNNYTTAKDVGILLEKIYNGTLVSSNYSNTMLSFLKKQNTKTKIPAGVSSGTVANKTGEISEQGVQNDAAIVYTTGTDYILVVMSTTNSDNSIEDIKNISNIVYKYYN